MPVKQPGYINQVGNESLESMAIFLLGKVKTSISNKNFIECPKL
jgi:hypothetical protein